MHGAGLGMHAGAAAPQHCARAAALFAAPHAARCALRPHPCGLPCLFLPWHTGGLHAHRPGQQPAARCAAGDGGTGRGSAGRGRRAAATRRGAQAGERRLRQPPPRAGCPLFRRCLFLHPRYSCPHPARLASSDLYNPAHLPCCTCPHHAPTTTLATHAFTHAFTPPAPPTHAHAHPAGHCPQAVPAPAGGRAARVPAARPGAAQRARFPAGPGAPLRRLR
jgi:hypothetical protein